MRNQSKRSGLTEHLCCMLAGTLNQWSHSFSLDLYCCRPSHTGMSKVAYSFHLASVSCQLRARLGVFSRVPPPCAFTTGTRHLSHSLFAGFQRESPKSILRERVRLLVPLQGKLRRCNFGACYWLSIRASPNSSQEKIKSL